MTDPARLAEILAGRVKGATVWLLQAPTLRGMTFHSKSGRDLMDTGAKLDDYSPPLASREDRERTWREVQPIIEPYRDSRLD